jgi:hypothetical protein
MEGYRFSSRDMLHTQYRSSIEAKTTVEPLPSQPKRKKANPTARSAAAQQFLNVIVMRVAGFPWGSVFSKLFLVLTSFIPQCRAILGEFGFLGFDCSLEIDFLILTSF